jgi:hypothetical protein
MLEVVHTFTSKRLVEAFLLAEEGLAVLNEDNLTVTEVQKCQDMI